MPALTCISVVKSSSLIVVSSSAKSPLLSTRRTDNRRSNRLTFGSPLAVVWMLEKHRNEAGCPVSNVRARRAVLNRRLRVRSIVLTRTGQDIA